MFKSCVALSIALSDTGKHREKVQVFRIDLPSAEAAGYLERPGSKYPVSDIMGNALVH